MAIIMQYGASGSATTGKESAIVASGTIDDGSSVILELEAGRLYELFTWEYAIANSAFRGMRGVLIAAPEAALFGTVAVSHVSICASSNAGVSITYNADSTVTVAQTGSGSYAVNYVLRDLGIS